MIRHDINIKNPYGQDKFKMPKAKVRETYLEYKEIEKLRDLQGKFSLGSTQLTSLHMYLLACYTGFRISDILDLKWTHINLEANKIEKIQVKTKNKVTSVITPWVKALLLLYSNGKKNVGTDKPLFENPVTSNTVNLHLKVFAKMAGINKTLSSHTARHTFVNLVATSEKNILTVKTLAGHSKISSTMVYFHDEEKIVNNFAKTTQLFGSKNTDK